MNFTKIFFLCVLSAYTSTTLASAKPHALDLPSPVFSSSIPTQSLQEKSIESLQGQIDAHVITMLKQLYFVFEYFAKLEKLNAPSYSHLKAKYQHLLQPSKDVVPFLKYSKQLTQDSDWNSIEITKKDLIQTDMWQLFLQSTITDTLTQEKTRLKVMHYVISRIFAFLPSIETAYYTHDFTGLRNVSEGTRVNMILHENIRARLTPQCSAWKALQTPQDLAQQAQNFTSSEFYQFLHNPEKHLNGDGSHKNVDLGQPMHSYLYCALMILEIQQYLSAALESSDNLVTFLQTFDKAKLAPSIMFYTSADFVYLEDLLLLQGKMEEHTAREQADASNPHPSQKKIYKPDDVVVQGFFQDIGNFFKGIWHGIEDAAKAIWHGIEDAVKAVWNVIKGIAQGLAGVAAEVVGDVAGLFDKSAGSKIKNWGQKELNDAKNDFKKAGKDLNESVDEFGKAIKDGVIAPTADLAGAVAEFITDDRRIGLDVDKVFNQVGDTLVNIGDSLEKVVVTTTFDAAVATFEIETSFATLVANATVDAVTGNMQGLGQDALNTLKQTGSAILMGIKGLVHAGKDVLISVMQGCSQIVSAISTIITDVVREATFLAGVIATGNIQKAIQMRDKVTHVMDQHRKVLNTAAGVVLAVALDFAVTVFTGGAGDAALPELDAALIAGETGAEVGAETGAEVAAETGAEASTEASTEAASQTSSEATDATETTSESSSEPSDTDEKMSSTDETETDSEDSTKQDSEEEEKDTNEDNKNSKSKAQKLKQAFKKILSSSLKVLNYGMMAAGAEGSEFQNENNLATQMIQEQGVKNLWTFSSDMALSTQAQESAMLTEMETKKNAAFANQALEVNLYRQYLTQTMVDATQESASSALAGEYEALLATRPNGGKLADIGYSWGLETSLNNIYPQQGMYTATLGRPNFPYAQEIAQAPQAVHPDKKQKSILTNSTKTKFWFNQKSIIPLASKQASDPLEVSMHCRTIYTLDCPTYFGWYLGGSFYDYRSKQYLQKLQETATVDLDTSHLAKMFVVTRDSQQDPWHIGVYEHEGKGWIIKEPIPSDMTQGWPTFTLNATLDKDTLQLTVQSSSSSTTWTKTLTVTPTDQRTCGVISSGCALEWNINKPKLNIQANTQVRSQSIPSEQAREKQELLAWHQAAHPTFGNFTLNPLPAAQLIRGQYVYTTTTTGLPSTTTINPDYVVFCSYDQTSGNVTHFGCTPQQANAAISLVSGHVYNPQAHVIGYQNNSWQTFNKQFGSLSEKITTAINQQAQTFLTSLQKVQLGVFNLQAANNKSLQQAHFVYTTTQTLPNQNIDYMITADISGDSLGSHIGAPPCKTTQGLLSLVTGNLYKPDSLTPITGGYSQLGNYETEYGQLPHTIRNNIINAQQQYSNDQEPKHHTPKAIIFGSITESNTKARTTLNNMPGLDKTAQGAVQESSASFQNQQTIAAQGVALNLGGF